MKLVLATGNAGKVREFNRLLDGLGFEISPQSDYSVPEADETGLSFVENAIIKARNAARHTGLPALADDSGLEVDALHGAPGIYSARYAGPDATDADNRRKLLTALDGVEQSRRGARFCCVIVLMRHGDDPSPLICHGYWLGSITTAERGEHGFGYDPVFYVPEQDCTAAELTPALKNRLSHRARALVRLRDLLKS